MRRSRQRWHRYHYMERKDDANCAKACSRLMVEGTAPVSRPKNTWQNNVPADTVSLISKSPRIATNRRESRYLHNIQAFFMRALY